MKRQSFILWLCLCPAPALGQPVTPADLEGAVVDARVILDQQVRREGRQFGVQLHQQIRIAFLPDGKIEFSITPTSHSPRGVRRGAARKGTTTFGKARESKFLGGGQTVWIFEDEALTSLRTYAGAGGYKRTIAFARQGQSITCSIKETFVREEGVGRVALRSGIDSAPVTVLSAKQVGSSCRVGVR